LGKISPQRLRDAEKKLNLKTLCLCVSVVQLLFGRRWLV
jgi:hypothetical protein